MFMNCTWCKSPTAQDIDGTLCRTHEAEALGTTEAELDRRDAEQDAEWLDTFN
jgi:hypothetical protein